MQLYCGSNSLKPFTANTLSQCRVNTIKTSCCSASAQIHSRCVPGILTWYQSDYWVKGFIWKNDKIWDNMLQSVSICLCDFYIEWLWKSHESFSDLKTCHLNPESSTIGWVIIQNWTKQTHMGLAKNSFSVNKFFV